MGKKGPDPHHPIHAQRLGLLHRRQPQPSASPSCFHAETTCGILSLGCCTSTDDIFFHPDDMARRSGKRRHSTAGGRWVWQAKAQHCRRQVGGTLVCQSHSIPEENRWWIRRFRPRLDRRVMVCIWVDTTHGEGLTHAWAEFHWRQNLRLALTCIVPAHSR
jgi:hypothetical protein